MNYRFKKKPVTIEAFQMTPKRRKSNEDWPNWLHAAWQKDESEVGSVSPQQEGTDGGLLFTRTLEGVMAIDWDDWIIQGAKGELYPCKPDIFALTYDPAPD